jgi:hypothetical protein
VVQSDVAIKIKEEEIENLSGQLQVTSPPPSPPPSYIHPSLMLAQDLLLNY